MSDNSEETQDQAAALQKLWMESMSKLMQTAFAFGQGSAPPEVLRQIRSGIFQALAQSWEEFMRSPQFLQGMKQWMENAITFRKMTNDFMAKARNELQAPSREDIDTIMLAVRHLEKRVLDTVEELSKRVDELNRRLANVLTKRPATPTAKPLQTKSPKNSKDRSRGRRKAKTP